MRKKEQSNLAAPSPRRFTLPKSHILRGRRNFQRLFANSKFIHTPTITIRYASYFSQDEEFKIGFISPKKIGTAVKRNRTKRLMREAYRLNKHILSDCLLNFDGALHAVFIARRSDLDYQSVESDMVTLLENLRSQILSTTLDEL
jgi:ribonuclease P protein component